MNNDNAKDKITDRDILEQIRDKLGDLPDRLAEQLRSSRQMRFQQTVGWGGGHGETGGSERWRATEGLLGATHIPILQQFAEVMGNLRRFGEAASRFAEAWQPPPASPYLSGPQPVVGPLETQQFPRAVPAETFGVLPEDAHRDAHETLTRPTPLPEGYGTIEGDWRERRPPVASLVSDEAMAEFRHKMSEMRGEKPIPFAEDWTPQEKPAAPPVALPEPYSLKPDDWRPQPFEVIHEEERRPGAWKPEPDAPEPAWAHRKPEIGFAPEWKPPEKPDFKPLRETPEGWRDVQSMFPMSARQGWQEAVAGGDEGKKATARYEPSEPREPATFGLAPEYRQGIEPLVPRAEHESWPEALAGNEERENTELLRRAVDLLETIARAGRERDTGQLPPATEKTFAHPHSEVSPTTPAPGHGAGQELLKHAAKIAKEAVLAWTRVARPPI